MMKKKLVKPWGHEILLEHNRKYVLKKLFMRKGQDVVYSFIKKKPKRFIF